jgi:hypothetical protein
MRIERIEPGVLRFKPESSAEYTAVRLLKSFLGPECRASVLRLNVSDLSGCASDCDMVVEYAEPLMALDVHTAEDEVQG